MKCPTYILLSSELELDQQLYTIPNSDGTQMGKEES